MNVSKEELIKKIEGVKNDEELREITQEVEEFLSETEEKKEEETETEENVTEKEVTEEENIAREEAEDKRSLLRTELIEERSSVEQRNLKIIKEEKMEVTAKDYTNAWAKSLLLRNDFTETEKRALDSLTTTSKTFIEATDSIKGVNNGGLLIPEEVSMEILRKIELQSPFLSDVTKTNIKGILTLPYKVKRTDAKWVSEGTENELAQIQFANITLNQQELSITIRMTWKLEAMAISEFVNYITDELASNMGEQLSQGVLYGTGQNGQIKGATIDPIIKINTIVDPIDAIKEGINKLDKRDRISSKVYVSTKIANDIIYAKDKNGAYLNTPINGMSSLNTIGAQKVEVDPFLKDNEILIGDPSNYRLNFNEPVSITKDTIGRQRVNDYTGYTVVGGTPIPGSFVHIILKLAV